MPLFKVPDRDYFKDPRGGLFIRRASFDRFHADMLGLGDLSLKSKPIESLAVVVDLEGFTQFCSQIDPQLALPTFLKSFLTWLLETIKEKSTVAHCDDSSQLCHMLPYFVKFMGDGLLILWNTEMMVPLGIRNVIHTMYATAQAYRASFYPSVSDRLVVVPPKLRCGIALGRVFSVGKGNDFVGPCINLAARLQKLPGLSFAFGRRGFDLNHAKQDLFKTKIVCKKVQIRGIENNELVCVLKNEFSKLDAATKKFYKKP